MRTDNLTNLAYVGPNDGRTDAAEVFYAYHPDSLGNSTAIAPGETTVLRSAQTGKVRQAGCGCLWHEPLWLRVLAVL